ncbi:MAG TPA: polyamine aminopropyltransferase [Gammaproteobacteria bacterium]|nr:polyamine aminopropyltransferase [Gammaproteobacteria bacterium]
MTLDKSWFTEVCDEGGSAFSLKIKEKLHEEQTPYQRIEIYDTEHFGKLMVIDGFVMLTDRHNFIYHEMMSHPALFTHPNPRSVVVIGGGDCGTVREVLKHPEVRDVWQVEIDERVTRLSERYFPELCESNDDPRAHFYFGDGIKWMADAEPDSLDVVIIDSTDPIGPAKGLFTEEFYRNTRRALRSEGILVQQSESPMYHMNLIKEIHQAMRGAGFLDVLTMHFPQPVYPSGWWTATLACKDLPVTGFREADAEQKAFPTRYYNAAIHRSATVAPQFFYEQLMK